MKIKGPKEPKWLLKMREWKKRPWCYVLDVKVSHRLLSLDLGPQLSCGKLRNHLSWGRPTRAGSLGSRLEVPVPSLLPNLPRYKPALATTARSCPQPCLPCDEDCEWNRLFLPCVVSRQIFGHGNGKNNEVAIGSQHSLSNLGNSSWLWETDRGIQRNWWRMSLYMDIWNSECSKIQHFLNAGSKSPNSKTCILKQWDATSREGYSTHGDARSRH